jgi:hypothetical protein
MKLFSKGDRVYFMKPGCLAGVQAPIERVVFDHMEDGLGDSHGIRLRLSRGHIFAADLGTTSASIRYTQMMAEAQGSNRPATLGRRRR